MKKTLLLILGLLLSGLSAAQDVLIVQRAEGVPLETIVQRYGDRVTLQDFTPDAPFALFGLLPGQDIHVVQNAMLLDPQIVMAEDDEQIAMPKGEASKGATIGAVGDRNTLYAMNVNLLRQIKFNPSYANSPGREVRVAILDTGMSAQRPELWAKTVASTNFIEPGLPAYDMPRGHNTNGNGLIDEGTGHGSFVTGIIDQMAPQAKLIVVRLADSDGVSRGWYMIKGLAFAVVNGAEVINISFGSEERVPALQDALEWAEARNAVIFAPIGNNNRRETLFPADSSHVICVAGVDDEDEKAAFSNWDSDALVAAPATGIRSYMWDGKLGIWSGTSFATPIASGLVADSLRRRRPWRAWKFRALLDRYGDNIDGSNPGYSGKLGKRINFTKLEIGLRRSR